MNGPNVQTWYCMLFGWMLSWVAGDYGYLLLLPIGIASVIADARARSHATDDEGVRK